MGFAGDVATVFFGVSLTLAVVPSAAVGQSGFDFPHQTDFLTAGCFTHVAPGLDATARRACIDQIVDRGYTHFYVYAYNERDYGGPSFDFYADVLGFKSILQEIKDAGLKPVVWLNPDDAIVNRGRSTETLKARMDDLIPAIDPLVSSYVLGLELDEYWGQSKVDALGQHLATLTNKKIAVHQLSGRWNYCRLAWCDYMMLQYGFELTEAEIETTTTRAMNDLGKPVVAGEYSASDESVSIRLGDVAVSAGAKGFGNGGTPGQTPEPAPDPGDTTAPNIAITSPSDGDTVRFSSRVRIEVEATDDSGIASVAIAINGRRKASFTGNGPYIYLWRVRERPGRNVTISAQATDEAGNSSETAVSMSVVRRR